MSKGSKNYEATCRAGHLASIFCNDLDCKVHNAHWIHQHLFVCRHRPLYYPDESTMLFSHRRCNPRPRRDSIYKEYSHLGNHNQSQTFCCVCRLLRKLWLVFLRLLAESNCLLLYNCRLLAFVAQKLCLLLIPLFSLLQLMFLQCLLESILVVQNFVL